MPALKRVGHKGAGLLAPGNSAAAFAAGRDAGADMLEFDVLSEHLDGTGELYLAHDYGALATALTLDEGLDLLSSPAFAGLDFDVDLKLPGYEARVIAALRERGLEERALISTMELVSLPAVRAASHVVRLGWSVPRARRDPFKRPHTKALALAYVQILRRTIPSTVAGAIRRGEVDAAMAHWSIVTPRFVRAVREAGGDLYVWTVDDAVRLQRFMRMGVTGIITNDPRLFGAATAAA